MGTRVDSAQHFAVTSAKSVAVFQASLKLASEEAEAPLSNKDNKHLTSHSSNCFCEGGHYK